MDNAARARLLIRCLDLTNLDDDCTTADIDTLIRRAVTPIGPVAAICIWPRFVAYARSRVPDGLRIATVVNFPHGAAAIDVSEEEAAQAIADGADEIDYVMRRDGTLAEISAIREACLGKCLKVILETGARDEAEIAAMATIALDGGADFIKTSTGKTETGATAEAVSIMLAVLRDSGRPAGIKPSGGVRRFADAALYADMAQTIMGEAWVTPRTFRLGASSLLDDLLSAAEGRLGYRPAGGY